MTMGSKMINKKDKHGLKFADFPLCIYYTKYGKMYK